MTLENRILNDLNTLDNLKLLRELPSKDQVHRIYLDLSHNDYLGFATNQKLHPEQLKAPTTIKCLGSSSSRVLAKYLPLHSQLESSLANFLGFEDSLLYGSGYLANVGVLSGLIKRNDFICSDQLIHASLIDGIILSRAKNFRFRHNDPNSLEDILKKAANRRNKSSELFIVVESVYSMDGDIAPLPEIIKLAETYEATLVIDEAHAIGVLGREGRGIFSLNNSKLPNVILLGTLSKSLAAYGGFVACSKNIKRYLLSKSRSFLFSTALPEIIPDIALMALEKISAEKNLGDLLLKKADHFRKSLINAEVPFTPSETHIQPIHLGDENRTLALSTNLLSRGIRVPAIRPPTVPANTSRLRCSINLTCDNLALEQFAMEIANWLKANRSI
ncbi:MAG TPA: 8-amino-7-oxononanoate synthase [Oligoflexia bacterium]|nr:8-amino-7-oxononanoate synthase [Oligoflexia bacterium]HMP48365.1 8-amino-7-oxononanoate synthase [Oligoflexia bacterium]